MGYFMGYRSKTEKNKPKESTHMANRRKREELGDGRKSETLGGTTPGKRTKTPCGKRFALISPNSFHVP